MSSQARPRLIYLAPRFPQPLDRGDHLRFHHQVQEFAQRTDVTFVAFSDVPVPEAARRELAAHCESVVIVPFSARDGVLRMMAGVGSALPFQVSFYRSRAMRECVRRLADQPWDVGFAAMLRMVPYLELLRCGVKIVDFADSGTLRVRRALPWVPALLRLPLREELRRVERYERQALLQTNEGWVVAEPDRQEFVARMADARVTVVPNGVVTRWGLAGLEGPKGDRALFLGNLTVSHNRDAARHLANDIWPRVRARRPGAVLRLVGRHDGALRDLASCPGVRLEGFVEDLTPLLRDARVAASPLRFASGLQNKVLETMAAGLPNVVPPVVNEAIGARPGDAIVVADGADAIATAIVAVMEDVDMASRIGAAGSAFVRERFPWGRAGERLSELLHHAGA